MITHTNDLFCIDTENTSYIFSVENPQAAEHIYYGRKLNRPVSSLTAIREKHLKAPRMSTIARGKYSELCLNDTLLEFSLEGNGDYKTPLVALSLGEKGDRTLSLKFESYQITKGIIRFKGAKMPQAVATQEDAESLVVTYVDNERKIKLITYYTSFYKADVITRRATVINESKENLSLRSLLSASLDLRAEGVSVVSFSGKCGSEKEATENKMGRGTFSVESRTIMSGENDPTVIVSSGRDTYLMSLIYSGAHRTTITETPQGITHITTGINPDLFSWNLNEGEFFESPEAVLSYSPSGKEKCGTLMKKFIENHIRRGKWKNRIKPIILSTFGALSYDVNEADVLKMAKEAKNIGIEGICVDDGWFGARSDNTSSLGDWYANTLSFPSGIKDLSNEVHYMGLLFGLWFEMEGISERSMLYKSHQDWIVGKDALSSALSNNEFLLDITRSDVQEWVIETLIRLIESSSIDYIKWSLSRFQGDLWSNDGRRDSGEFMHRYTLGLYHILDTITKTFPNLYIEVVSKGGMRFDMGMLSYASSISVTESSLIESRLKTIEGTGMIYPLSVMTNVISSFKDSSKRETLFNTSSFGVLNYSINPLELSKTEMIALRQQIDFYKAYRPLLQYGNFLLQENSPDRTVWSLSNGDSSVIILLYYLKRDSVNTSAEKLYAYCANENYIYSFMSRPHIEDNIESILHPQEIECYKIPGDALVWAGISLADNISGNGFNEGMRTLRGSSSRLYIIKREVKNE